MEKVRIGKWAEDIATAEEFESAVAEIKAKIEQYGWADRIVHPYGCAERVGDMVNTWEGYVDFTLSSKQIMVKELNGLIDILNKWEEQENEPKAMIQVNGKVKEIPQSFIEDYMLLGATLV